MPINAFAADQDELCYDHDWVECEFFIPDDLRILMDNASYAADYVDEVIAKANSIGVANANTYILADAAEFSKPISVDRSGYRLCYIGTYNCNV